MQIVEQRATGLIKEQRNRWIGKSDWAQRGSEAIGTLELKLKPSAINSHQIPLTKANSKYWSYKILDINSKKKKTQSEHMWFGNARHRCSRELAVSGRRTLAAGGGVGGRQSSPTLWASAGIPCSTSWPRGAWRCDDASSPAHRWGPPTPRWPW